MSKKKSIQILEKIEIIDAGSEGMAVARLDNKVVFVPFAVPGDICDIQVIRKRKSYLDGKIVKIHKYSDKRVEAKCEHFGLCGGCKWQNMLYEDQLFYKQKQVKDNLSRIGKIELPEMPDILASKNKYYYRNKLEFSFSYRKWFVNPLNSSDEKEESRGLGFHLPGKYNRILDIHNCYLQPAPSNKIRLAVKEFAIKNGYSFYNVNNWQGFLRNLLIRNTSTGELMVILVVNENDTDAINNILQHMQKSFPEINSLMYSVNKKKNTDLSDQDIKLYYGKPYIQEDLDGQKFRIGPKSFFQTNSHQALNLYRKVKEFAEFKGNETVYDLYTGTGSIAIFLANDVKKVIGIDNIQDAIADARVNAEINNLKNTIFHTGDINKILDHDFVKDSGKPDVIITDPPRAGMHEKVCQQILEMQAEKIIYVSCNPATQARDLALLDEKYKVMKIQAVDMFPHTQHVENIVLLHKRTK